jgi:hypothetical protein
VTTAGAAAAVSAAAMAAVVTSQVSRLQAAARGFVRAHASGRLISTVWVLRKFAPPASPADADEGGGGSGGGGGGGSGRRGSAPHAVGVGAGAAGEAGVRRPLLTHEVIAEAGLASYDYARNPRYREAALLLREAARGAAASP